MYSKHRVVAASFVVLAAAAFCRSAAAQQQHIPVSQQHIPVSQRYIPVSQPQNLVSIEYAPGVAGSRGIPTIRVSRTPARNRLDPGRLDIVAGSLRPHSWTAFILGFEPLRTPDGSPGLAVRPDAVFPSQSDQNGVAELHLPLPFLTGRVAIPVYAQVAVIDPSSTYFNVALTPAISFLITTQDNQDVPKAPELKPGDLSGLPRPGPNAGPLVLPPSVNMGGPFVGQSVTINTPIDLDPGASDLEIVVEDDLEVKADIKFPAVGASRPITITLVSLQGKVTIFPNVKVGFGRAAPGYNGVRNLRGGRGHDGSYVKIVGVVIDVLGEVVGMEGGQGGRTRIKTGGSAFARAGGSGKGGKVSLAAQEAIHVGASGKVCGGTGGEGGMAVVQVPAWAAATGGSGGAGADVIVEGTDPNGVLVQVFLEGLLSGGGGGAGGIASAIATDPNSWSNYRTGEFAAATAGHANHGGTVSFSQADVFLLGGIASAGDGGLGSRACDARGGDGENETSNPPSPAEPGGHAVARGGNGGKSGATPAIPTLAGIVNGRAGSHGTGGSAHALSGRGGDGLSSTYPPYHAKQSGRATAKGGKNGSGARHPRPEVVGPLPPRGNTGVRATAHQAGR